VRGRLGGAEVGVQNAVLQKPFSLDTLAQKVRKLLDQS